MKFSEYFKIDPELIQAYGAVDISLICDIPLFIDPMLIFNSEKPEYKELHNNIIKYFYFLFEKAQTKLSKSEIHAWFKFSEIKNNWFGYALSGNEGSALGNGFAEFLYENIEFVMRTNDISKSIHAEKSILLYKGSGKDRISDMAVNLIHEYLLEYTQKFACKYINPDMLKEIPVERAYFNYDTQSFVSKVYTLPFIINKKGKLEHVILTPYDILRYNEPAINKKNFVDNHQRIRASIEDDTLRAFVNNYIIEAVRRYEKQQSINKKPINLRTIEKIEKGAFLEIVKDYPILYDYYIKLRESDIEEIKEISNNEYTSQIIKFFENAKELISVAIKNGFTIDENSSAREEAKNRIEFFKHIIEDCDGYRNLYTNGVQIANENDLQRLFKFVWYGTNYKVNSEVNNGRGSADFIVSYDNDNQSIIEFKLASNSRLAHVFTQVKIYEKVNCTDGSIVVIFYFSQQEYDKAQKIVVDAGHKDKIDNGVYLIDCRNDNKPSASVAQ